MCINSGNHACGNANSTNPNHCIRCGGNGQPCCTMGPSCPGSTNNTCGGNGLCN
jgi:hypothetical protein